MVAIARFQIAICGSRRPSRTANYHWNETRRRHFDDTDFNRNKRNTLRVRLLRFTHVPTTWDIMISQYGAHDLRL